MNKWKGKFFKRIKYAASHKFSKYQGKHEKTVIFYTCEDCGTKFKGGHSNYCPKCGLEVNPL